MTEMKRDSVQSLERAFDLLEALSAGGELGVTELANRTASCRARLTGCCTR
jgi:DNA-binding IclR family transcriptional regulator